MSRKRTFLIYKIFQAIHTSKGEKKMPKTKIQSIVFTAMRVFCMFMFPDSTFTANILGRSICTSDVQKCIQWRRDGVPESDGQQDCQYI